MSRRPLSDAKSSEIIRLRAEGLNDFQISKRVGCSPTTVAAVLARNGVSQPAKFPSPSTTTESDEIAGDTRTISLPKTRICTVEELVEYCKIDLGIWSVERWVCNKWEMGFKDANDEAGSIPLFQIKAFLAKKKNVEAARNEIDELRKKAANYAPRYPAIKKSPSQSGNIAEVSIFDHHFGALIWGKETGGPDYDTKIARRCWEDAVAYLVQRSRPYAPDKALLILGNDQQNADNKQGTTTAGTPQNMDSRYQKVFGASRDASIWAIEAMLGEYGAVDVIMVPGNHDAVATWHLGDTLASWFRHAKTVNIDNRPMMRKYYEHGINMLLFTHGDKGKLEDYDRTMSSEQPEMWGRTKWREAHTGDKHHRRLIEHKGATVRILPSLRPACSWSAENHYVGAVRAAESYIWNRDTGLVGTAVYSILGK